MAQRRVEKRDLDVEGQLLLPGLAAGSVLKVGASKDIGAATAGVDYVLPAGTVAHATTAGSADNVTQATDAMLAARAGVQKIVAGAFANAVPSDFAPPDTETARLSLAGGSPATVITTVVPTITDGYKATVGIRITGWKQGDLTVMATADWVVEIRRSGAAYVLVGTPTNVGGTIVKSNIPNGWTTNVTLGAGGLDVTVLAGADATYWRVQAYVSALVQLS